MPANEDQIEILERQGGTRLGGAAGAHGCQLSGIHDAILAFAAPRSGETVLDIGCGTGTTSMVLADRGRAVRPRHRHRHVASPCWNWHGAAGQGAPIFATFLATRRLHPFAPEHDLLFSRFGVMFFDDPVGAFTHLRGALKAGGRLAFVCWRTPPENPWASAPVRAAKPFLPDQPPPDPLAPGPFAFSDPDRIRTILVQAGFAVPRIEPYDGVMNMGPIWTQRRPTLCGSARYRAPSATQTRRRGRKS